MKKVLLIMVAVLGLGFAASAQNNLGLRLGSGAEISWQTALGTNNRLELDLGANGLFTWNAYRYFGVTGIYQWHWYLLDKFGWYVGPGAQVSLSQSEGSNYFNVALGGQIGLDYELPIPLQLSLDWRPMWNFLGSAHNFDWGVCLGVRYMF